MFLTQPAMEAIANPVILKNEAGIILGCNQAFFRLRNIPLNKIIGYSVHDFLGQIEADLHVCADKTLLNGTDDFIDYEYEINDHAWTKPQTLNIHKSIIQDLDDGKRGILAIVEIQPFAPPLLLSGSNLSPRENDVLVLLVQGKSQKQIARHLMISHHTVADYCKSIYKKLGVKSRTEAQLIAISQLGITSKFPL